MGQAAVDLPNPIDRPAPGALPMSADDLLAQLAGDEIDRLLADADAKPGDDTHLPESLDGPEVPQLAELLAATKSIVDAAAFSPELPPRGSVGSAAPPTVSVPTPVGKLDDALSKAAATATAQVVGDAGMLESAVAAAPVPTNESAAPAAASTPGPGIDFGPARTDQPTTHAERAELAPANDELANELPDPADDLERVSLVVRLLEVINLPFIACPQIVRDLLGKVAILTALNSVGVLLYVMLFRRH